MDQEIITKGILSGIVDRYIREIAQDPNRSIRKLLDMAECTSDGPTQKICYQMMQQMAADLSSPYYEMIYHLVIHTDSKTIKQFGINLGHNAWTFGSGNIRRTLTQTDKEISWAVFIDRSLTENRIPLSKIRDLIARGRQHDVYAWLLKCSSTLDEWDVYTALFHEFGDSIFGLITDSASLDERILDEAARVHNLMIILDTDSEDWQHCAVQLSEKGLLFSACRFVSRPEQANEILCGNWLEELVPCHPLMAFSITGDTLPAQSAQALKDYLWNTRLEQVYPVLPVDLISDFVIINGLVVHRRIFFRVEADGSVAAADSLRFGKIPLHCDDLF